MEYRHPGFHGIFCKATICLMIVILQKNSMKPRVAVYIP